MVEFFPDGQDLFTEIPLGGSGNVLSLSYWDLWFLMVLVKQFAGDWNTLLLHFRENKISTETTEGMLNHTRQLHRTLQGAGVSAQDILSRISPDVLRGQSARARRKVRDQHFSEGEKSIWMIETPRWQQEKRALRGFWPFFPVSPQGFVAEIEGQFKPKGFYTEDQSLRLAPKLGNFLTRRAKRLSLQEYFALDRAFLTVMLEKIEIVDDSYGVIGDLYKEVILEYTQLDRSQLAMPAQIFLDDLLSMMIWEDYGFTKDDLPEIFSSLDAHEVPLAEAILERYWKELAELDLDYQSEAALTMLGLLYTRQKMFDHFIPMARIMGGREWQRITRMAEMAENENRPAIALAVYEACGSGRPAGQAEPADRHEEFLREKYEQLRKRLHSLGYKYSDEK